MVANQGAIHRTRRMIPRELRGGKDAEVGCNESPFSMTDWIWIPIVLAAAFAQTLRNASQRSLIKSAGTLPATFVRFGYGLPFTIIALLAVSATTRGPLPESSFTFIVWVALGAFSQLAATAFLIRAMAA